VPSITTDGVAELASLPDLLAHKLKVIMQRVEPKDYRDIAALLSHGESLETGLAAAARLVGPHFSPSECVKVLGHLEDENLAELATTTRELLISKLQTRKSLPPQPPCYRSRSARGRAPTTRRGSGYLGLRQLLPQSKPRIILRSCCRVSSRLRSKGDKVACSHLESRSGVWSNLMNALMEPFS